MKPLLGTVTSTKMKKTATVEVVRIKVHPVYQKRYRVKKKYLAHNDKKVKEGDRVKIQECRPISKSKKWKIMEVVKSGQGGRKG
jgi:small subunit ribosomal protein S17